MKKHKNILLVITTFMLSFFLNITMCEAASARINVSSSTNKAIVGSTFKVTVNVSSNEALGSWEYTLSYDSSKAKLVSGQLHVVDYGNGSKKSASYTYTFKAIASGNANFKAVNASVLDYSTTNEALSSSNGTTVNMITQAELEASYSKNNNLSSLSIEGAELSPAFNKDVTEYTATVPVDTTQIVVNASVADNTATVSGTGNVEVVDGPNRVVLTVTAQNGSKKEYVINVTVLELDPVKVTIDKKEYTVIRKPGQITELPTGFSETKITIENQEVVAYKSEATGLTLVGLKDSEGNAKLFIYDENTKKFSTYSEVKQTGINLFILDNTYDKVPYGFEKTTFKYNDENVNGWYFKPTSKRDNYLVYALNLDNGKKDLYVYDKTENTFQKYYKDLNDYKDNIITKGFYVIIGLVSILLIVILTIVIKFFINNFGSKEKRIAKLNKKLSKLKSNKELDEDEYEENDFIATKVEVDEYSIPRKSRKEKRDELNEARKRLSKEKDTIRRVSLEDDE